MVQNESILLEIEVAEAYCSEKGKLNFTLKFQPNQAFFLKKKETAIERFFAFSVFANDILMNLLRKIV